MRKNFFTVICVLLTAFAVLNAAGCMFEEKSREQLLEESFADAEDINNCSYFGEYRGEECLFLSKGKGGGIAITHVIDNKSNFYCFPYADSVYITEIVLRSPEYNVYGIRQGGSIEEGGAVLEEKGFIFEKVNNSSFCSYALYRKGYIAVSFGFDPDTNDDIIKEIVLVAHDPQQSGIIY